MWKTPSLPQKRAFKLRPEGYGSTSWPLEASFVGVQGQEQEESQWRAGTEEMLACRPQSLGSGLGSTASTGGLLKAAAEQ